MKPLTDIILHLRRADLNKQEEQVHFIPKEDFDEGKPAFAFSCYSKVVADKEFSLVGVRNVLNRAWDPCTFKILKLEKNIFLIFFTSEEDMVSVLFRRPWNISNHLFLLVPWFSLLGPWDDVFCFCDFWAQLKLLPNYAYTEKVAFHLWHSVNNCIQMQLREEDTSHNRFFQLRLRVDLQQPIRRLIRIACSGSEEHWALLFYKRVAKLCYCCGKIGHHLQADCDGPSIQDP